MIFSVNNSKTLNLEGLDTATRKVTIGFKCNPKVKLKLAKEANKYGFTLSEYIESLLLDEDSEKQPQTKEISKLKDKIAFYENDILKSLFDQYEGKEIVFKNSNEKESKIKITELKDIYTIIINSYKIKK